MTCRHGRLLRALVLGLLAPVGCMRWQSCMPQTIVAEKPVPPSAPAGDLTPAQAAQLCLTAGVALEKKGFTSEALCQYENARKLDPHAPGVARHLAVVYDLQGDASRAEAEYLRAWQEQPGDAELLNDLGYFNYRHNHLEDAESWLRKAVATNPRCACGWTNLGQVLASQGRAEESYEAFTHALRPAEAYSNVGILLAKHGHTAEARKALQQAVKLDPSLSQPRAFLNALGDMPGPLPPGLARTPQPVLRMSATKPASSSPSAASKLAEPARKPLPVAHAPGSPLSQAPPPPAPPASWQPPRLVPVSSAPPPASKRADTVRKPLPTWGVGNVGEACKPAPHPVVARFPDRATDARPPVVARFPDRATDGRPKVSSGGETFGPSRWHGQETMPQQPQTMPQQRGGLSNPAPLAPAPGSPVFQAPAQPAPAASWQPPRMEWTPPNRGSAAIDPGVPLADSSLPPPPPADLPDLPIIVNGPIRPMPISSRPAPVQSEPFSVAKPSLVPPHKTPSLPPAPPPPPTLALLAAESTAQPSLVRTSASTEKSEKPPTSSAAPPKSLPPILPSAPLAHKSLPSAPQTTGHPRAMLTDCQSEQEPEHGSP